MCVQKTGSIEYSNRYRWILCRSGEKTVGQVLQASYQKLWRLLKERRMKKKDLQRMTGLSSSVITKLGKNEPVHLETLIKICTALQCGIDDIVEFVPKENTHMANFTKTAIKSTFLTLLEARPLRDRKSIV